MNRRLFTQMLLGAPVGAAAAPLRISADLLAADSREQLWTLRSRLLALNCWNADTTAAYLAQHLEERKVRTHTLQPARDANEHWLRTRYWKHWNHLEVSMWVPVNHAFERPELRQSYFSTARIALAEGIVERLKNQDAIFIPHDYSLFGNVSVDNVSRGGDFISVSSGRCGNVHVRSIAMIGTYGLEATVRTDVMTLKLDTVTIHALDARSMKAYGPSIADALFTR
jgi:hypothetical protein